MDALISPVERATKLRELVRQHADDAERNRRLSPVVAQAMAAEGLYRIAAPREFYGEEVAPIIQIRTIEEISRADASAGWNLMIGIESFGLIAPAFKHCRELIADPLVVLCGSTAAVGRADRTDGGYLINGQWQFVSGCHNSQIFCATVRLHEDGEPVAGEINRYAIVELPDFEIIDTWKVGGLCGSGSHDVRVENVLVPPERIVAPIGGTTHSSPLLRFPLAARLAYNKVGVSLGVARAAIDAFVELAEAKTPRFSSRMLRERSHAHRAVAEAEVRLRAGRALVFELTEQIWQAVVAGDAVDKKTRALFQISCSDAVRGCAQAVDLVAEAAGTSANQLGCPLERMARDVRVVGQHLTVAAMHIEDGGRVLLGLEPKEAMLKGLG
jgi:alkylation response protein AidB-like acyl-CoA dehydrogenase